MRNSFLLFIFFIFSLSVYANIRLNIGVIHKSGIDKGLILVSELYSVEQIDGVEGISLQMKNNIRVDLMARFVEEENIYGPSSLVKIEGNIYDQTGKLIKSFFDNPMTVRLGETKTMTYKKDEVGQLVEIMVQPEVY